jgi:predicted RNA-binding Zn ribbon-like protein
MVSPGIGDGAGGAGKVRWPGQNGRYGMADRFEIRWGGAGTADSLALDLTNTLDWRLRTEPVEFLRDYAGLLRFGWSEGVMTLAEAKVLRAWSEAHPRQAARALTDAVELREAIASILSARLRRESPPAKAMAILETSYHEASQAKSLRGSADSVVWSWREASPEIERVRWAVALDAVRLLTSPDAERIRQCADAECGWFFLDKSRNQSRRWCSMQACGNRNKVRSFYRRSTRPH